MRRPFCNSGSLAPLMGHGSRTTILHKTPRSPNHLGLAPSLQQLRPSLSLRNPAEEIRHMARPLTLCLAVPRISVKVLGITRRAIACHPLHKVVRGKCLAPAKSLAYRLDLVYPHHGPLAYIPDSKTSQAACLRQQVVEVTLRLWRLIELLARPDPVACRAPYLSPCQTVARQAVIILRA
jgi:hypothetical protein